MTPQQMLEDEQNKAYIEKVLALIRQKPNQAFSIDIDLNVYTCSDEGTVTNPFYFIVVRFSA